MSVWVYACMSVWVYDTSLFGKISDHKSNKEGGVLVAYMTVVDLLAAFYHAVDRGLIIDVVVGRLTQDTTHFLRNGRGLHLPYSVISAYSEYSVYSGV